MPIGVDTFAYYRDLPHLQKQGKTYFVTFCTLNRRVLPFFARDIVLETCIADHEVAYWLHRVTIMPDHAHMLFTPHDEIALKTIMSRIKSTSAHRMKLGRIWQREYFDRILRSDEDVFKKSEYIANNPVRAGIVKTAGEYPWSWSPYN